MIDDEVRRFVDFWRARRRSGGARLSVRDNDIIRLSQCSDECCKIEVDLDALAETLAELLGEPLPNWAATGDATKETQQ